MQGSVISIGRKGGLWSFALAIFIASIHFLYLNTLEEDAFISFRYSRNLVEGHGLVFNIGEKPVEGYTNFLWVLIGALVMKLGGGHHLLD